MVFHNTSYHLHQIVPVLKRQLTNGEPAEFPAERLVELLIEGVMHPLNILKKRSLNISAVCINSIFPKLKPNPESYQHLASVIEHVANDPPYHPTLNIGQAASKCVSLLPPK